MSIVSRYLMHTKQLICRSEEAVKAWSDLAFRWFEIELGPDADVTQAMQGFSHMPTMHPQWATKEELVVGLPQLY